MLLCCCAVDQPKQKKKDESCGEQKKQEKKNNNLHENIPFLLNKSKESWGNKKQNRIIKKNCFGLFLKLFLIPRTQFYVNKPTTLFFQGNSGVLNVEGGVTLLHRMQYKIYNITLYIYIP